MGSCCRNRIGCHLGDLIIRATFVAGKEEFDIAIVSNNHWMGLQGRDLAPIYCLVKQGKEIRLKH